VIKRKSLYKTDNSHSESRRSSINNTKYCKK